MNEYYTPPTQPPAGSRARSATIEDIIDSVDAGFDNIPADLAQTIEDLQDQYIEQIGLPAIEQGKFLTSNDGVTLDWGLSVADQTDNAGKILTTDGTDTSWTDHYPSQTSNSGKFLTTDGTDPSWETIPVSGHIYKTSSGAITAGDVVVLNSNGTVSTATAGTGIANDPVAFEAGAIKSLASCYDSANDVTVFVFQDDGDSDKGKAVVGTITDGVISFGSTATFETGVTQNISCCYDSTNGKVVICYMDDADSDYGKAVVGTVSGTDITFGTIANFSEAATTQIDCCFDEATGKVAICYYAGTDGKAKVGTVTGTDIAFGAEATFDADATDDPIKICYDSQYEKIIIAYEDAAGPQLIIGDISGTDITFEGQTAMYAAQFSQIIDMVYDPDNNKVLYIYSYLTGLRCQAITVISGSGFSGEDGTPLTTNFKASGLYASACYNTTINKVILVYGALTSSNLTIRTVDLSAAEPVGGTAVTLLSSAIFEPVCAYTGTEAVIGYSHTGDTNGQCIVYNFSTTTQDWIGIAAETVATAETVRVTVVGGVDSNQTGLTTGGVYNVDIEGALTMNPTAIGRIGRALSATEILITEGGGI